MKIRNSFLLLLALSAVLVTGCAKKPEPMSKSGFLLNTFVTVTIYDKEEPGLLDGCMELCRSYENLFSKTIETSEVFKLNHRRSQEQTVSADLKALLSLALSYCEMSQGAFDVTIEPLSSLWDFTSSSPQVPPEKEVKEAAEKVNYQNLKLEENHLTFLGEETAIDLGAVAKGYIADRMKDYLLENGVKSAIINLGGNVLTIGAKPDGSPFKIGLQKPYGDRNETIETLNISDMSVVSSGVYERHFEKDGVNYHHILNPKTGFPYENGLVSVTILSKSSADGDALSTACFSLGLEKGMGLLDSLENVCGIFITEDGQVHYSKGVEGFLAASP